MTLREHAHAAMQVNGSRISAAAGLGMVGFVFACLAHGSSLLGVSGCLATGIASLALYGGALGVGHLGHPFPLPRPKRDERTPDVQAQLGAAEERQVLQVPRSSWTWPVNWNPNLSATSDCKTSIASN